MQCSNNTSNVPNLPASPAHHKCAQETYISLWLGKTIWHKAYFMIKCWISCVINWQQKWKIEGLSVSRTVGRVWVVHPRGLVADGGPWPPPTTPEGRAAQKPGEDQQSHVQVWFQLNACHFHNIVKLKNQVEPSSVGGRWGGVSNSQPHNTAGTTGNLYKRKYNMKSSLLQFVN